MNQQRARRFRSAQEARENDEKKEELQKLLARQQAKKGGDEVMREEVVHKTWDSNVITPGTPVHGHSRCFAAVLDCLQAQH